MTSLHTILIVDDEEAIRNFICAIVVADGYHAIQAENGRQAEMLFYAQQPDVVLLDLGLPDIDGIEVLRHIRDNSNTPIIVVSAREHEKEKVLALDLGADDYIVKPFGTEELLARIRAAIRHNTKRTSGEASGAFISGSLLVDFDRRVVTLDGKTVHLTQIEYRIMTLLCRHPGHVLTHEYIIKNVWGPYAPYETQILRVNMANIRRKLEKNPAEPQYILTEVGVGYRMADGILNEAGPPEPPQSPI